MAELDVDNQLLSPPAPAPPAILPWHGAVSPHQTLFLLGMPGLPSHPVEGRASAAMVTGKTHSLGELLGWWGDLDRSGSDEPGGQPLRCRWGRLPLSESRLPARTSLSFSKTTFSPHKLLLSPSC